jgi:hypothetical protein
VSLLRRAGGDLGAGGDIEAGEIEALITDRYLDSLLAIQQPNLPAPGAGASDALADPDVTVGAAVRAISRRLADDLPRFHPSFRFEERVALRLAEMAASMRLPVAAGGESQSIAIRRIPVALPAHAMDPMGYPDPELDDRDARPFLIGGAVAASALSLAGAWLAWRRRTSPMTRAARAAHAFRLPGGGA